MILHTLCSRRHVLRGLSLAGATWLRPALSWTQPLDAMTQPAQSPQGTPEALPHPS